MTHEGVTRQPAAGATENSGRSGPATMPGLITYVVLLSWAAIVSSAIVAGVFAGDGLSRLALPAAVALPIAVVMVAFRTSARFNRYVLALDTRLVLAAQLWRMVGIVFLFAFALGRLPAGFAIPSALGDIATGIAAFGVVLALGNGSLTRRRLYAFTALGTADFLVAFVTGLTLEPPALSSWPLAVFPTIIVPFFAVLHLIAVIQSRHDWETRVHNYTIHQHDQIIPARLSTTA
jgi:hypothetical protein